MVTITSVQVVEVRRYKYVLRIVHVDWKMKLLNMA